MPPPYSDFVDNMQIVMLDIFEIVNAKCWTGGSRHFELKTAEEASRAHGARWLSVARIAWRQLCAAHREDPPRRTATPVGGVVCRVRAASMCVCARPRLGRAEQAGGMAGAPPAGDCEAERFMDHEGVCT